MMRLLRASTLVALFVVTSAETAYADCAWVLWQSDLVLRGEEPSDKRWSVLDSAATLPECKVLAVKGVETTVQLAKMQGRAYTVNGTTVTSSDVRPTSIRIVNYLCLPNTVDPRGPKGK